MEARRTRYDSCILTPNVHASGIILAAGKGTRMKSELPKVLHRACGLPLAEWVGRALVGAGIPNPVMVIGHGGELLQEALGDRYQYVWQREQLGTGHAALQAAELMAGASGPVIVASGDTPLLTAQILRALLDHHRNQQAVCTIATFKADDPTGYGRIVREATGNRVARIVEQKDANEDELKIGEVNSGLYVFDSVALFDVLPSLGNENAQCEYYLTDAVQHLAAAGGTVTAYCIEDGAALNGVNDRWQLALADEVLRERILRTHAVKGVTFQDLKNTYVEADVEIGPDTTILAGSHLRGSTTIGEQCVIGPNTTLNNCHIGNGCTLLMSHLVQAKVGNGVKVGPFANLRPGTVLEDGVKIGNFVEVKNSTLGAGVASSHLTYIGDAVVGVGSNIGAGTITCNYDGFEKFRTEIGAGVFVGSNSTLVAPVTIGDGAFIAAGSVVTHDVPADALALGRARQEVKEGWVLRWRKRKGL